MSNIITIAGDDGKKKGKGKGEGMNEVLTLMKELIEFQEKVQICIDSQAISDNRQKLEQFYDNLDSMAEVLLGIAESGLRSKRGAIEQTEDVEEVQEEESAQEEPLDLSRLKGIEPSNGNIRMVSAPFVPKFPY